MFYIGEQRAIGIQKSKHARMLDRVGKIRYLTFLGVICTNPKLDYGRHDSKLNCIGIGGSRILQLD